MQLCWEKEKKIATFAAAAAAAAGSVAERKYVFSVTGSWCKKIFAKLKNRQVK